MLDANHYLASYNKAENDIAEDFYLPSMRASCKYDRISGYFGSTVYIIAWPALKEFINNNGKCYYEITPIFRIVEPFNFGILFNYSLSQPYRSADTSRSYAPGGA